MPVETNDKIIPSKRADKTKLNAMPNSELNGNDYNLVAKNISHNVKIDDKVKVIFIKNSTEIKNVYSVQEPITQNIF